MAEVEYKRCSMCGELLPNTNEYFYYAKKAEGILCAHCKKCDNACKQKWREKLRAEGGEKLERAYEKHRQYYQTHKEQYAEWARKYMQEHREQYNATSRRYRKEHPEKRKAWVNAWWEKLTPEERAEKKKQYYQNNYENQRRYEREHQQERYEWKKEWEQRQREIDPLYDFKQQMRAVVCQAFRRTGYVKAECDGLRSVDILGCSYEELQKHLIKTFKANYGYDYTPDEPVHVDHIIPLSTAQSREDVIKLNHYTNLQLLKPFDNLTKQDRLDFPLCGDYSALSLQAETTVYSD